MARRTVLAATCAAAALVAGGGSAFAAGDGTHIPAASQKATKAGSLLYWWNHDGSPTVDKSVIAGKGTIVSAPSLVYNGNLDNTEIAAEGH
jgi:hypothetical protein